MSCDFCPTGSTGPAAPGPHTPGAPATVPATPSALVAACAPLLGFRPENCLVGFIAGVPGRSAPVLVRLDLGSGQDALSRAAAITRAVLGTGGDQVSVVAWVSADRSAPTATLPSTPVLGHLARQLRAGGVFVRWLISTDGTVWWSHGCTGSGCPSHAQPLDAQFMARAEAEYVFAGYAPLSGRAALAERIAPDHARSAAVRDVWTGAEGHKPGARWREQEIEFLSLLLVPGATSRGCPAGAGPNGTRSSVADPSVAGRNGTDPNVTRSSVAGSDRPAGDPSLTPGQITRVLRGLNDIVVRDVVVHRLAGAEPDPPRPWARTEAVLCDVVRSTPAGLGAAPATLLAMVAWLGGDGALANLALDRAGDDDPEYRLAGLTRRLIDSGMDPRSWRSAIRSMPEQQCWAAS